MKLGFSTLGCPDWDLETIAKNLSKFGYDGVELRGKEKEHVGPALSMTEKNDIKRLFESYKLEIHAVTAYSRFSERATHTANIDELKSMIELASDLGASFVRTFGGNPEHDKRLSRRELISALIDGVSPCLEYAREKNVTVLLETHDSYTDPSMVLEIMEEIKHPNFKALLDLLNPTFNGHSTEKNIYTLRDYIGYCHIKDAIKIDDHYQLCLMGAGNFPLQNVLQDLSDVEYDGYLVVEWEKWWHSEIPEPEIAVPQHIIKFNEARRELQANKLDKIRGEKSDQVLSKTTGVFDLASLKIDAQNSDDKIISPEDSTQIITISNGEEVDLVASGEHQLIHLHVPKVQLSEKKWIGYSLALFNIPDDKKESAIGLLMRLGNLNRLEAEQKVDRSIVSLLRDVGSEKIYPVKVECEKLDLPFRITHPHKMT